MGLSLNNVNQQPYFIQNNRSSVKKREDEERSAYNANREEQSNQTNENSKSKGLQYYSVQTPAYEQYKPQHSDITYPNEVANALAQRNPNINIAQILKDFNNTAIAIGTPSELKEEVNGYVELIEKQISRDNPSVKLIKSNLKNAASILDNYISQTLNKDSKVVENWVDALFLQNIDFKYDENSVNKQFLVKFPEGTDSEDKQVPENTEEQPVNKLIPQDTELKKLFIQAKKMTYANKPKEAIKAFQTALNRANEIDDTETQSKIYLEVGKIYDEHDYLAQALASYNESAQRTEDCNVKTRAHYSMAEIYNDTNNIDPAIDHYFSTVAFAGVAENLTVQAKSLTKIGNIYSDMYQKDAFDFYEVADTIADETDNSKIKGYVSSSLADAYDKFGDSHEALKSYSKAVKNYINSDSPKRVAQNYFNAAGVMLDLNNKDKAKNLLAKAEVYAKQADDTRLLNEIRNNIAGLAA